ALAGDVGVCPQLLRRDEHAVAFFNDRGKDTELSVLAAEIDDALRHIVFGPEVASVLLDYGLSPFFDAADSCVLREVVLDGANAGLLDIFGRGKIRFAWAEVHHIDALLA